MTRSEVILASTIDAIGGTPLVALSRFTRGVEGQILAKLEYLNPGFSKKDRIARQMIEEALSQGTLKPGQTVVELTSGNTGTGLAIVCGVLGHPFVAVMSKGNSMERARMMAALGAEVVLVDQAPGSSPGQVSGEDIELVECETQRIVRERYAFRADQFQLAGNARAHYLHTGPEILEQTKGAFGAFCDFAGTGGSFAGCAAAFKEHDPNIRCYLVEPEGAAVLAGEPVTDPNHRIQGGGYSMPHLAMLRPEHADTADTERPADTAGKEHPERPVRLIDGYIQVTDEEAIAAARRLAKEEGIFAGFSSGANVAAAMKLLAGACAGVCQGKTIVVLLNDSGLKYLSTDLWE